MICPKCNNDIGENQVCQNCGSLEGSNANEEVVREIAENQSVTADVDSETTVNAEIVPSEMSSDSYVNSETPNKKNSKIKIAIIAAILLALLIGVGIALLFFLKPNNTSDEFVKRNLYFKENSIYYLPEDNTSPILITDQFFIDEENTAKQILLMNGVEFSQKGNKVFYAQKYDIETNGFSLYYRFLNKPEEEPFKLAEDVENFVVDDTGNKVIYLDIYGNLYAHNMEERTKIISDVSNIWISKDCANILFLLDDGGLYIQAIEGEKEKIDSDVTKVYKTTDNLENIYYYKEEDLYLKKADSDRIKIDAEITDIVMVCDNGGVYYTKDNEIKGKGTLMDYIVYSEEMQSKDESLQKNYYATDWRARNEAINRIWSKEVLEETEIETSCALYYFNGESSELINSSFVNCLTSSEKANSLIITSFDNVKINKVDIKDFVNAIDAKHKFRADEENGIFLEKSDFQALEYFNDFKKMVLGAMKTDSTTYIIIDGKPIQVTPDGVDCCYAINDSANTVYYLDKFDEKKGVGELKVISIADGLITSNEMYDSEVSAEKGIKFINDTDILYTKDCKEDKYDLYLNKQLIEYDVGLHVTANGGKDILFYTDLDEESVGSLHYYSNGEKLKIADDVYNASILENETILYFTNYSQKSEKGDLYVYSNGESIRIDYDVQAIYSTSDLYSINFIYSNKSLWDSIDIDWDNVEINFDDSYYDDEEDSFALSA